MAQVFLLMIYSLEAPTLVGALRVYVGVQLLLFVASSFSSEFFNQQAR